MSKRKADADSQEDDPGSKIMKNVADNRIVVNKPLIDLKELSAIRIAIAIFEHSDVRQERRRIAPHEDHGTDLESSGDDEYHSYSPLSPTYRSTSPDYGSDYMRTMAPVWQVLIIETNDSITKLPVPLNIQNMVKKYVTLIQQQMEKWISYHHKRVFFTQNEHSVMGYADEIYWKCNGFVDYLETAKKLLHSPRLSDIEKFRVMCTYCLKENIESVSPLLFSRKYMEHVSFNAYPLLFYWQCFVKGDIERVLDYDSESVNGKLITMRKVDNKYAIKYFFDGLSAEEKIEKTIWLIRQYGLRYQAFLLNELSETQQHHVFVTMAVEILINYATKATWSEAALSTWIHIRNYATDIQFVGIVEGFFALIRKRKAWQTRSNRYNHIAPLLRDIWTCAPAHLKYYCLNHDDGRLIDIALQLTNHDSMAEFELVVEMLNDSGNDLKKNVVRLPSYAKLCEKLVLNERASLFNQLLKYCPSSDIMEFKKEIIYRPDIKYHVVHLVLNANMNKVDEMLKTYLGDTNYLADYKAQILTFEKGEQAFRGILTGNPWTNEISDMEKAHEFLSFIFSDASAMVKKSVMQSSNGRALSQWMISNAHFSLFEFMMNLCFSAKEAVEFKKDILATDYSRSHSLNLCEKENFQELNVFLGKFLPNLTDVADYKAKILSTEDGVRLCKRNLFSSEGTITEKVDVEKNMTLFREIFADARADVKRELIKSDVWHDFCKLLVRHSLMTLLDHLINLCLNDDEAVVFKMQLANLKIVENHYLDFLEQEKYDEMLTYLRYFLSTDDAIMEYNAKILTSKRAIDILTTTLNLANYKSLNHIIDRMIPKSDLSASVKRMVVLAVPVMVKFQVYIQNQKFDSVKELIGTLLPDEKDANMAKEKLFDYYKAKEMSVIFSIFNESQYQSFLLWSLNSGQKVAEYKKSLEMNDIFIKLLRYAVFAKFDGSISSYKIRPTFSFEAMNRFLRWMLITTDAIKEFKMVQISAYGSIDTIRLLKMRKERHYLRKLILWFFDEDDNEMRKFKKQYPNCDILSWI